MADKSDQSPPSLWSRSKRSLGGKGFTFLQHIPKGSKGEQAPGFLVLAATRLLLQILDVRPTCQQLTPNPYLDTKGPNIKLCRSK